MIEIRNLSKQYGNKVAVDSLSFTVRPGQVTGFLGPNGAGKSTTMRLILDLDRPTAGQIFIEGSRYGRLSEPLRQVGALLEAKSVHGGRSAYHHLLWLAQSNRISKARVREVLELVGLPAVAALVLAAVPMFAAGGPLVMGGVMCAVAAAVTAGLVALWTRARGRELRILRVYPWQVWPCAETEVRVVSAEGRRENGRRWSTENRVVLLQPDGQSHCSFPGPGRGHEESIWFAGDTRYGGILAVPGGFPFRHVMREKPGKRKGTPEEEALAVQARLRR